MFIGHVAIALAAKRPAPRLSLGVTLLACQFADLLLPVLVILGIERVRIDHGATAFTPLDLQHYPWSHSLGMSLLWSLAAFLVLRAFRFSHLEAAVLGTVVFSHWVLDVLTHRPDVPLWFGDGPKRGRLALPGTSTATATSPPTMDPHQAWLVLRGLCRLAMRVEKTQDNATKLAEWLESHPQRERMLKQMSGSPWGARRSCRSDPAVFIFRRSIKPRALL